MDWYASVKPYPSTLRAIRLYFNIVVRAAVLALIWGALLGIGTGLNWLIDVALGAFDASEQVKNVSLQVSLLYIVILGVAMTFTSLKDVWDLTRASLRKSSVEESDDEQGEQK